MEVLITLGIDLVNDAAKDLGRRRTCWAESGGLAKRTFITVAE